MHDLIPFVCGDLSTMVKRNHPVGVAKQTLPVSVDPAARAPFLAPKPTVVKVARKVKRRDSVTKFNVHMIKEEKG